MTRVSLGESSSSMMTRISARPWPTGSKRKGTRSTVPSMASMRWRACPSSTLILCCSICRCRGWMGCTTCGNSCCGGSMATTGHFRKPPLWRWGNPGTCALCPIYGGSPTALEARRYAPPQWLAIEAIQDAPPPPRQEEVVDLLNSLEERYGALEERVEKMEKSEPE